MNREEYHELLKDGRWQRKRLEVMQRDDFRCRKCGTTNNLNVHHLRYLPGRAPWEYDNDDLITLCGDCHKQVHEESEIEKVSLETIEDSETEKVSLETIEEYIYYAVCLRGRMIYYKHIGDYNDVITIESFGFDEGKGYFLEIPFFFRNTSVIAASYERTLWMFSECNGNLVLNPDEIKLIKNHVWQNWPDDVLGDEQKGNILKTIGHKYNNSPQVCQLAEIIKNIKVIENPRFLLKDHIKCKPIFQNAIYHKTPPGIWID